MAKRLIWLSLLFVTACGNSIKIKEFTNSKGEHIVQEWDNSNRLKSVITYYDTTGGNFTRILFDKKGRVTDSSSFKNNSLDGRRKFYDASSGLTHIENYNNGILNGPTKAIFNNGVTDYIGYFVNGKKAGEWLFHYNDGRPITYEFYDSTGKLMYFRKYDNSGKPEIIKGSGIISISFHLTKTGTAQTVKASVISAVPPLTSTTLSVEETSGVKIIENKKIARPITVLELPLNGFDNKKYRFGLKITDSITGKTENYEITKPVKK